jgi:hypothetical protein
MLFQYQPGPRSSYRLISCSPKFTVWPNCGGSWMIGVVELSGAVRSMTSTWELRIASVRALSTDIGAPVLIAAGGHGLCKIAG